MTCLRKPSMHLFKTSLCLFVVVTSPVSAVDFDKDVAPILIRRCLECHQGAEPSGGFSLKSAALFRAGGDSGVVVVPHQPQDSLLLHRVQAAEMPPPVKGVLQRLPVSEQDVLAEWIKAGAAWPEGRVPDLYEVTTDVRGGRDWWAFQPVIRPDVPEVAGMDATAHPIDAFVTAQLQNAGMTAAPAADTDTIVRRLYHDVIGLPPSFEQRGTWSARIAGVSGTDSVNSGTANAPIAELVDHLLSSPHFGERWARFWLDLVRYAETSGYERDQPKPFAWKYRDWVVNAINSDMPYDQFVRHQLAGDEIRDRNEQSVIATGFLRLGTWNDEPNDDADYRYERLEDLVHATSSAFLGLTVKCARCHDHKFDPIPQDDYYRMASAFWPGPIAARDRKLLGGPSVGELGIDNVLGWTDLSASPAPLHVLKNGEANQPRHVVVPGALTFAPDQSVEFRPPQRGSKTSGRRRQLADWIVQPDNPLTARVAVNRIWQHHFGAGLVRSPNNFGYKGDLPTHPALLDWLASELIDSGWSSKHIHRLILTSGTWQQSSLHPEFADYTNRDSTNQLWWRSNRRRLNAEALRDSLLVASGEIDLRIGGESFRPSISAEALEGLSRKDAAYEASSPEEQRRRSLYSFVSRSLMPPMMTSFDQCETTLPCAQRDVTTVPTQALALLNNDFVHARSAALADRAARVGTTEEAQIEAAWKFALLRQPTAGERALARQHLKTQRENFSSNDVSEQQALASLCHVLLNSNEFLYVD